MPRKKNAGTAPASAQGPCLKTTPASPSEKEPEQDLFEVTLAHLQQDVELLRELIQKRIKHELYKYVMLIRTGSMRADLKAIAAVSALDAVECRK